MKGCKVQRNKETHHFPDTMIAYVDLWMLDAFWWMLILLSSEQCIRSELYVSKLFIDYHLHCIVIYPTEATLQVKSSPQATHC